MQNIWSSSMPGEDRDSITAGTQFLWTLGLSTVVYGRLLCRMYPDRPDEISSRIIYAVTEYPVLLSGGRSDRTRHREELDRQVIVPSEADSGRL